MWLAEAEYSDGYTVTRLFPYNEHGNYQAESDRQFELEEWLILKHDGCTWYSVVYISEDALDWYR